MTDYQKEYRENHHEHYNDYMREYMRKYRDNDEYRKKNREYMRKYNRSSLYCIKGQLEQIEHYELAKADDFNGWCIHHRLETHHPDGSRRAVPLTRKSLVELDLYYQRPAEELIFMRKSEHTRLHNSFKNRRNSDDNQ